MKPFDLEAAKRGEPVCNREGSIAESVHVLSGFPEECCVAARFDDGTASLYGIDGRRWGGGVSIGDPWLFMAPRKRDGWIALWRPEDWSERETFCSHVHPTKEAAEDEIDSLGEKPFATARIEWEE